MTSSRSFEIELLERGQVEGKVAATQAEAPARRVFPARIHTRSSVTLRVRTPPLSRALRVLLCGDLAGALGRGQDSLEVDVGPLLRDRCGEVPLELEMEPADPEAPPVTVLTALVPLEAPAEITRLYETLVRELEEAHVGLAGDVLAGMGRVRFTGRGRPFEPGAETQRLERHLGRLEGALALIGTQPSSALTRERVRGRWRPGDPLDGRAVEELARRQDVSWKGRRPLHLDRVALHRPRVTHDLPEHRHLRAELESLARRATGLREGCLRSAALLAREEEEWGHEGRQASVFEERYLPRIRKLERLAGRGHELAASFQSLVSRHFFLAAAGKPRTPFGPTPLFHGRRGYREAYEELREAREERGPLIDGQTLPLELKSLDDIYEYWAYVVTVTLVREVLGPPSAGEGFELVDEVYRPDLRPGQFFEWRNPQGRVRVHYEPAVPPAGSGGRSPYGWEAALVNAPLRPDIVVGVEQGGETRALVLDAKNTVHFPREKLFAYSDYRTLIHEPATGRQPVRQMFFIHRDSRGTYCSLPGYLEGRRQVPPETSLVGAVPLLPERRDDLRRLIALFLGRGEEGA